MKHKIIKIAVIAAAASIAVGGVCLGAGVAMGGSPCFYYDKNGIHVKERTAAADTPDHVMEYTRIDAVKNLDISLGDAKMEIVSGREWAVEYVLDGSRTEPEYSLEGQTLRIREGQAWQITQRHSFGWGNAWWYGEEQAYQVPYVRITIPETGKLEQVTVDSEYGDIFIEKNLKAQNVSVHSECGKVKLEGWEGDSLSVEMEYGDLITGDLEGKSVTVDNENGAVKTGMLKAEQTAIDMEYGELTTGDLEGRELSVKNENGTVKMGTLQVEHADFTMEYGDLSAAVKDVSSLEVDNENGSVALTLVGGMEKYGVSLHTEWGTIRTPRGDVDADEYDGSSDFIRTADGYDGSSGFIRTAKEYGGSSDLMRTADDAAGIRVYTGYGDIRVKEQSE